MLIDWPALEAKYWKDTNDLDLKRKKEAEFLVLGDISTEGILGYVVYNNYAFNILIELGIEAAKIQIKPNFYF